MTNIMFPLMVAGRGNSYKTTIALDIAYRQYLKQREIFGATKCRILILAQDMDNVNEVANIFSRNILGSINVHEEFTDKNIDIKLNDSTDYLVNQDMDTVKFLIIDDMYYLSQMGLDSTGACSIAEQLELIVSLCQDHGIKLITIVHPLARLFKEQKSGPLIMDHNTRHLHNRFVFTSDVGLSTDVSSLGNLVPYTKDVFKITD